MMRARWLAAVLWLPAAAQANDVACTFALAPGEGSLSWTMGAPATLSVDDKSGGAPLDCTAPTTGARRLQQEGFPRHVFEFDGASCRGGPMARYGVAARIVLIVHPGQGNRGTLFWREGKGMDECRTIEVSPAARRVAEADTAAPLTGTWTAQAIDDLSPFASPPPSLTFEPSGGVKVLAGCNAFTGTFDAGHDRLRVAGLLKTTDQTCASVAVTEQERAVPAAPREGRPLSDRRRGNARHRDRGRTNAALRPRPVTADRSTGPGASGPGHRRRPRPPC